jgi:PEP-CTERM motif
MKLPTPLVVGAVLGITPLTATAGVTLLSVSRQITASGVSGQRETSMAIGLNYFAPSGGFGFVMADHILFSGVTIGTGDQAVSFVSSSSIDTEFDGFVSLLTNGLVDLVAGDANLGVTYVKPLGGGSPEVNFFALPAGNNGVDFDGFKIDHIDFSVTNIAIHSTASEFSETGFFTDYDLSGFFKVYGEKIETVPEPSSIGLAVLGAAGLFIRRRTA